MRVVCLIAYLPPTLQRARSRPSSRSSRRCPARRPARCCGRQIMSPREMSISSASRTVTDIGGNASSTGPSAVSIAAIAAGEAGRQHHHLVARLEHARGDLAGVAAVVGDHRRLWTDHVLHREPHVDQVAVGGDVHVLQVVQQRRPLVPRAVRRAGDDVVAVQRGDRDDGEVGRVELGRERGELVGDRLEDLLRTSRPGPSC